VKAESTEESGFAHLQELSRATLKSYAKKAVASRDKADTDYDKSYAKTKDDNHPITKKHATTFAKRSKGGNMVYDKLSNKKYTKESIKESFTPGELKFKDGSKTVVKEFDASILNKLYSSLDTVRQKDMKEHVGKSIKNYKAVLEFAIASKGK
jgi:hypothetical protein